MITGIDHVQLAMPVGGEDAARGFYAGVLGIAFEEGTPLAGYARGDVHDPFGNRIELMQRIG